jgi:hypothetical protein
MIAASVEKNQFTKKFYFLLSALDGIWQASHIAISIFSRIVEAILMCYVEIEGS